MDKVLTNLKKLISKNDEEPERVDMHRTEDVRRTMAKSDPDTLQLLDADEMTQLAGASTPKPKLDHIKPVDFNRELVTGDRHRIEDVRQTMAKTDPDTLVDVDEMTQLAGATAPVPKLDDIKPRPSKNEVSAASPASHAAPNARSKATLSALNVLQKPAQAEDNVWEEQKTEEQNREEGMPNPIEDDIFIYYD